ncbi:MAG: hypothetical protein PVJ76_16670 [Gemmatimonadota bacterium]|jgi:hypothetical protein
MTILETLHLRMAGEELDDLVGLVRSAAGTHGPSLPVHIFCHSSVQGDLLVHLQRDEPHSPAGPSEMGLRLASLLRFHGLVEHSVWVRQEESRSGM